MLFGVYLLIRKRAALRYIFRLLAVYVSLLAPKGQANIGYYTKFIVKNQVKSWLTNLLRFDTLFFRWTSLAYHPLYFLLSCSYIKGGNPIAQIWGVGG
jgi:hypothetical protein